MKNIYLLTTIFILIVITGCGHLSIYDIALIEVELPKDAREHYGNSQIVKFDEEGKTKYSFEDKMVKIVWIPTSSQLQFILTNKTNHSIKIIWDDAVYVDENGMSKRVMHHGIKYIDRNNPQAPISIVRGATISDMIIPTDNVHFINGEWREEPLFPNNSMEIPASQNLSDIAQKYVGKSIQISLPIQIEDIVNEYIFTFKIQDFKIIENY